MKQAITLIKENCLNHYHEKCNVWMLAGNKNKDLRQFIYSDLTGAKQTKANSGCHAITEFLFNHFNPQGDCIAAKENDLYKILTQ